MILFVKVFKHPVSDSNSNLCSSLTTMRILTCKYVNPANAVTISAVAASNQQLQSSVETHLLTV